MIYINKYSVKSVSSYLTKLQPHPDSSPRLPSSFQILDRGPQPLVHARRSRIPKFSFYSITYKVQSYCTKAAYKDLKAKLVSSYTLTHWQRVTKVIHHPGLVDRGPTALMDVMLALLHEDEVQVVYFSACS